MTPADLAAIKARVEADDYSSYALVDNVLALVAEVERLRDALEPFAVIGRSVPRSWPDKGVIDFTPVYDRASPYFAVRYLGESAPDGVPTVAHWVAADHALRCEGQPHP